MPHYGSAFLKLHEPEIEKLQDHEDDDDGVVAEHQDQHEDDGEAVVEHQDLVDTEVPEHTYSSCLRCMQVLSEQIFHGHLASEEI